MPTIRRFMESQQTTVDTATPGVGPAGETTMIVPAGMTEIWKVRPSSSTDGAALGSCVIGVELTGDGIKNSPQRFVIGGGGAEVTNATHFGNKAATYTGMGIAVIPGNPITVNYYMLGEDSGSTYAGVEYVFSSAAHGPRLQWKSQEVQAVTIDANIGFQNWAGGATAVMPVPVQSSRIHAIMTAIGGDIAALGSGGAVALGTGNGVVNTQEISLGACGGENITESGFWDNADFETDVDIAVRGGDSIAWFARMTGEDVGTLSLGLACAFVI
jgi:hypothetical protein